MNKSISFLMTLFIGLSWAICHVEKAVYDADDVPEKLRLGHGCRCWCPEQQAIPYVQQVDSTLTTYLQLGQFNLAQQLINQSGTYTIVKPAKCGQCYKFKGVLDAATVWGCVGSYDFVPASYTYQKNGVVVVKGRETVKDGKVVLFEGEVTRYYSADFGCDYRLELVLGADDRCQCCQEVGCAPKPTCVTLP